MRSMLAVWYPRVREILMLIGSHNLLATPSKAMFEDARLRPLIEEFVHGANDMDAERRASIYRLAWDFIGSGLGSRNELYERNYLGSAKTSRTHHTFMYSDRDAACALVESMLT
jgi:4-hydroxyphenylacetate 3-monooxygenase